MRWIIIVEGADNVGKSHFIKNLYNELSLWASTNISIEHCGSPVSDDPYNEQKKFIRKTLGEWEKYDVSEENKREEKYDVPSPLITIYDRSIFGELVYSKFRGYTVDYKSEIRERLSKLISTRIILVVFYADSHSFQKFEISPKDDEKKGSSTRYQRKEFTEEVSCLFLQVVNWSYYIPTIKQVVLNSSNFDALDDRNEYALENISSIMRGDYERPVRSNSLEDTVYNPSFNMIRHADEFTCEKTNCPEYMKCELGRQHNQYSYFGAEYGKPTGSCGTYDSPRFIFVGEAPGQLGCGTFGIPFYGDLSGNLFWETLEKLAISPLKVFVTNSILCCPKDNDLGKFYGLEERLKLWCVKKRLVAEINSIEISPSTKIVALGKVAHKTLIELQRKYKLRTDVPIISTYHPAYYLRMGMRDKYSQHLGERLGLLQGEKTC